MSTNEVAIAPDLFEWPSEEPALIGFRCADCGETGFPFQSSCQKCGSRNVSRHTLASTGYLWTWTSQSFLPKQPYLGEETEENFQPYYVGYVELPGETRVEARLAVADESELEIGMPMRLVVRPFRTNAQGETVMMYSFEPLAQ